MKRKPTGGKKGMTLIEIIVAMAIVAVVAGAAYTAIAAGTKTYKANVSYSNSQSALRSAMLRISREERTASAIVPGAASLTFTIEGEGIQYAVSGDRLLRGGEVIVEGIRSISSSVSGKVLTVTLTAADGNSLSTRMHID